MFATECTRGCLTFVDENFGFCLTVFNYCAIALQWGALTLTHNLSLTLCFVCRISPSPFSAFIKIYYYIETCMKMLFGWQNMHPRPGYKCYNYYGSHTHTHAVASSMFGCICTSLVSPGWMGYGRRWRCVCALFSCLLMHIIPMWIGNEYGFICYYYCRRRRNVRRKWWKHTFSSIRMDEETVFLSFFYFIFCVLHLGITEARALAGVSDANEAFVATQTTKILRYSGEVTES